MKRILLPLLLLIGWVAEIDAQTATLYVIRKSVMGFAVKTPVTINDVLVGKLGARHYFECTVPVGKVKIGSIAENDDSISFDVRNGEKHYVLVDVKMGVVKARVNIMRLDESDGLDALEKCKLEEALALDGSGSVSTPVATPEQMPTSYSFMAQYNQTKTHFDKTKQLLIQIVTHQNELLLSSADRTELATVNELLSQANTSLYTLSSSSGSQTDIKQLNDIETVLTKLDNRLLAKYGMALNSIPQTPPATDPQQAPLYAETSPAKAPVATTSTASAPSSDVDVNIPVTARKAEDTFVLIIANENYMFVDNVEFALNDGEIFREYCIKTLGVPERQVWIYKDASAGIISGGVEKMVQAMSIFENAKVIVYYCGHGIPDEKTGDAYIIPTDGKGTNVATCYSLKKLYKTLSETNATSVTYFMDACFSGANRDGSMLVAARGVAREAKKETISGNTIVFSAASGDETAMPFREKQHGLFTYFLLKKLQETKGAVSYGELADYLKNKVKREAFLTNEKPQNPVVATSVTSVNTWRTLEM